MIQKNQKENLVLVLFLFYFLCVKESCKYVYKILEKYLNYSEEKKTSHYLPILLFIYVQFAKPNKNN